MEEPRMNIHSNARTCPNSRATIVGHVKAKAWCTDQAFAMGVSIRTGFKWSRRYRDTEYADCSTAARGRTEFQM